MNYAEIKHYDIANGPGIRLTLFVSGCRHHCKGCFNEVAWDFNYGKPFTEEVGQALLDEMQQSCYEGLTLLGGEPMEPENQKGLLPLLRHFKERYPDKTIWCFTGFLFDRDVIGRMMDTLPETKELLSYIDVMVDGKFVQELKDITLLFRGSSNQRIIDVPKSLRSGGVVLWEPDASLTYSRRTTQ